VAKIQLAIVRVAMPLLALGLFAASNTTTALAQQQDDVLSPARSLLQQGKNREAISSLKTVATNHPKLKGVNHELGVAYYREGEYLEAAKHLQSAWDENNNDHDAVQLLGLSYYFSGRPQQAIPALERVRSWRPDANIDAMYILGVCFALTNRYAEALEIFAQLYGVSRDSASAHLLLGRLLLRQGLDPAAQSEINTALLISPRLPLAHLTLGELNVYGGNYAKALEEFQTELTLNPACATALTHMGEVYWRLNRDEDSRKVLLRSIVLDSMTPEPYVVLGKVLLRKGQSALAEQNLQHAIRLDPTSYTAHYFLGQLYRNQGRSEAAQREMKAAARIQQLQAASTGRN
jgi:tetratricopeptide (TPR) repeat protein